jgi:hypothetical protein
VSQVLLLDSGPLGLLTHPQRSAEVLAVIEWLTRCLLRGSRVIVPAIVYYELKPELLRAKRSVGVVRLDAFVAATPGRYLPLSDDALRLAAGLWAKVMKGQPTADPKGARHRCVIIAAQALSFGAGSAAVIVGATNPRHLTRFITAKNWDEIVL